MKYKDFFFLTFPYVQPPLEALDVPSPPPSLTLIIYTSPSSSTNLLNCEIFNLCSSVGLMAVSRVTPNISLY